MKMFKKMAVLAAALMMVSVFVSCDNNTEEAGDGIVAEFYGYPERIRVREQISNAARGVKAEAKEPVAKVTFYDDDTFKVVAFYQKQVAYDNIDSRAADNTVEIANGTYEGNPAEDGDVKITLKMLVDMENGEPEKVPADEAKTTIKISKGKFNFMDLSFERIEE